VSAESGLCFRHSVSPRICQKRAISSIIISPRSCGTEKDNLAISIELHKARSWSPSTIATKLTKAIGFFQQAVDKDPGLIYLPSHQLFRTQRVLEWPSREREISVEEA
jgi:hypothetical protein